jgi:hypothetical protein
MIALYSEWGSTTSFLFIVFFCFIRAVKIALPSFSSPLFLKLMREMSKAALKNPMLMDNNINELSLCLWY